ncbi:MAG: VTT domain-containing protein [Dialister sp.]|nr:VTT domain-containing protein [Dialister sp.]
MIDSYKKLIGTLLLLILGTICFIAVKMYCPEFYDMTISLTLAGDVEGLSAYISSFGYGAFVVSILLLIICNILGIPTIPFLTINGALFGIIPGIIISWAGEVVGIEMSFHLGRIFFRKEARRFIEKKHMLQKLDKYSSVYAMGVARAIPYSPNILFTAIAVLTKLTTRQHLRASLIGKIPSVAIEVILGHDLIHFSEHGMRFVILFILTLGGFFMQRKYRKHKYHNND